MTIQSGNGVVQLLRCQVRIDPVRHSYIRVPQQLRYLLDGYPGLYQPGAEGSTEIMWRAVVDAGAAPGGGKAFLHAGEPAAVAIAEYPGRGWALLRPEPGA